VRVGGKTWITDVDLKLYHDSKERHTKILDTGVGGIASMQGEELGE